MHSHVGAPAFFFQLELLGTELFFTQEWLLNEQEKDVT
jgi:hypothetical protein